MEILLNWWILPIGEVALERVYDCSLPTRLVFIVIGTSWKGGQILEKKCIIFQFDFTKQYKKEKKKFPTIKSSLTVYFFCKTVYPVYLLNNDSIVLSILYIIHSTHSSLKEKIQRNFKLTHKKKCILPHLASFVIKLDGVGPVDNKPSIDQPHHFGQKL